MAADSAHGVLQRKDPETDSVKLTNAIAYAAQGADLWRIGAKKRRVQFASGNKCIEASRDLVDPVRDPQEAGSR